MDTRTESLVLQTIREVFEGCTVLTIAHRLITILDCDKVIVMDDGKVGTVLLRVFFKGRYCLVKTFKGRYCFVNNIVKGITVLDIF